MCVGLYWKRVLKTMVDSGKERWAGMLGGVSTCARKEGEFAYGVDAGE